MITSPASDVLIAKEGDDILGALTLIVFRIPTGVRAWIEDVVVDDAARGQGGGRSAEPLRARSAPRRRGPRPSTSPLVRRERPRNRLYQRIGFEQRDTNVYRYDLER